MEGVALQGDGTVEKVDRLVGERIIAWFGGMNRGSVTQWLYPSKNKQVSGSFPPRSEIRCGFFFMFFLGETKANPQETVHIGLIVPIVNSHLGKESAIFRPKSLELVETSIATLELKRKQRTVGECLG